MREDVFLIFLACGWCAATTAPKFSSSGTTSEWYRYQDLVLNATDPLWALVTRRDRRADSDFREMWKAERYQFGNFVYVPIPWHQVVERYGMLRKDNEPLRRVAEIFAMLDFESFRHFVTIGQASFEQARKYAARSHFTIPNLHKLDLIFTMRMENMDHMTLGGRVDPRAISIPLLYSQLDELSPSPGNRENTPAAFFSGSCTCPLRSTLVEILAESTEYDMSRVSSCGTKISKQAWIDSVEDVSWVLTPRGSFPSAYMLAETIQLNRLPVYIYGAKSRHKWRNVKIPPASLLSRHLPFAQDLDWNLLGAIFTESEISSIPTVLASRNITQQLSYVAQHRHMFTVPGTFDYILSTLASRK